MQTDFVPGAVLAAGEGAREDTPPVHLLVCLSLLVCSALCSTRADPRLIPVYLGNCNSSHHCTCHQPHNPDDPRPPPMDHLFKVSIWSYTCLLKNHCYLLPMPSPSNSWTMTQLIWFKSTSWHPLQSTMTFHDLCLWTCWAPGKKALYPFSLCNTYSFLKSKSDYYLLYSAFSNFPRQRGTCISLDSHSVLYRSLPLSLLPAPHLNIG